MRPPTGKRWSGPALSIAEEVRDVLRTPLQPGFELDVRRVFDAGP